MPQIVEGAGFIAWSLAVAAVAVLRPQLARALLAALFALMGIMNLVAAVIDPGVYQDAYGGEALIPGYRDLINGFWAANDGLLVLLAAVAQLLLAAAILARGRARVAGLVGAIVFLVLVAPTEPTNLYNLVFALGAVLLLRAERLARRAGAAAPAPAELEPDDVEPVKADPGGAGPGEAVPVEVAPAVAIREPAAALR